MKIYIQAALYTAGVVIAVALFLLLCVITNGWAILGLVIIALTAVIYSAILEWLKRIEWSRRQYSNLLDNPSFEHSPLGWSTDAEGAVDKNKIILIDSSTEDIEEPRLDRSDCAD